MNYLHKVSASGVPLHQTSRKFTCSTSTHLIHASHLRIVRSHLRAALASKLKSLLLLHLRRIVCDIPTCFCIPKQLDLILGQSAAMPARKSNPFTRRRIGFGETEIKMAHEVTTMEKSVSDFNAEYGTKINIFDLMLYPPTPKNSDLLNWPPNYSVPPALLITNTEDPPRSNNSSSGQPLLQKRAPKPSQKVIENDQATTSPRGGTNKGGLKIPRHKNEISARITKHYATPERHTQSRSLKRSSTTDLNITKSHKSGPTKLKIACRAWTTHIKIQRLNAEIQYLAALFDGTFHFSTPQAQTAYATRQHLSPAQRQNLEKGCRHIIEDVRDNQSCFSVESEVSHEENRRLEGVIKKDLEARQEAVKVQLEGGIVAAVANVNVLMQHQLAPQADEKVKNVSTWIDEAMVI